MVQAFVIEPQSYIEFATEAELLDKCKEWGLLSEKAAKVKTFYYRGNGLNQTCEIVGYVDRMTAVIEFADKQKHCIHPSYLKEMQASNFGQRFTAKSESDAEAELDSEGAAEEAGSAAESGEPAEPATVVVEAAVVAAETAVEAAVEAAAPAAAPKAAKSKSKKIELPEEKVKMTATVKTFATVPNHFSDTDDEVVIYEAVAIAEPSLELGEAWSSYSATLKKLELAVGDTIAFEAKVIAKKLTKHPVPYKINNPSKIEKQA